MEDKTKDRWIRKEITSRFGSRESSEVYLEVDTKTGESELVISKTITERYPVQDIEKVKALHERLNGGGGRRMYSLEDLTKN